MKPIPHKQNTPEWETFRRSMVGASDVPIILGKSPFKTAYQLYFEKATGDKGIVTKAMQDGTNHEGAARVELCRLYGNDYQDAAFISSEHDWLMASYDAYDFDTGEHIEIKTPGEKVFREIYQSGKIPEYWNWQCQAQMCVSKRSETKIFAHNIHCKDLPGFLLFAIDRDNEAIAQILKAGKEFHRRLVEFDPPEPDETRDLVERNDPTFLEAAESWRKAYKALKEAEEFESIARECLINLSGDSCCRGGGVSTIKFMRRGNVEYTKIPQLKGVDLELYRKPSKEAWRINSLKS